jgi:HEAT repeat protein
VSRNNADARPVLEDIGGRGLVVDSVADLFNKKLDYRAIVPILIDWLPRIDNRDVKEDIVRALSVKWAKGTPAARALVAEFERADDPGNLELRWAIGNALEVLASDELAEDLMRLACERRYGRAREMVVLALGKLKDPRATDVLLDLLEDDEVVGHAVSALGKLRAAKARSRIEPLVEHPKAWIRQEARKALARIDKAN